MIFKIEHEGGKGEVAPVNRCTLAYVAQHLKLKPSELQQFRALGVGEGLQCGVLKVWRIE